MRFDLLRPLAPAMLLLGGLTAAGPAPAPLPAPALAGLGGLEHGDWELKLVGEEGPVRHLCIGDARQFLQVQHPRKNCTRFVVADTADRVTVTYDCAAAGNGRTDLRIETPRLVQIQSQGIADSAPFSFMIEARRVGACH